MTLPKHLELPFFHDQHRKLAAELGQWVAANRVELESGADVEADTRRIVAALGRDGWLRYLVPGEYGGALPAVDVRSLCLVREHLAFESGVADCAFAIQGLSSTPLLIAGAPALKDKYLPRARSGERIGAFALSEPDSGSDVANLQLAARKDGDAYILDGMKSWISNAGIADYYVVFARTGGVGDTKGLSAFVVDADTPGLTCAERPAIIAPHAIGTLAFRNCRVSADMMLGQPGDGFKVAMSTLDIFRATVGAAALGFARRAMSEAVSRVKQRVVFGQKLAQFQATQMRIADMEVDLDAAALLVYRAAWAKDTLQRRVTRESAIAKLHATEAAQRVIDSAVQLFGGEGVTVGNVVERLYREIRPLRIYEGTSEIQKVIIAGQVLGRD